MKVVLLSDIHIFGEDDPLYESLLALMRETLLPGDHLVLAGDIFDFLVGDQSRWRLRYAEFFSILEDYARRDIVVTYIEGNHDFHVRGLFSKIPSVRVLPSETEIQVGTKLLYVAHGDLVDRADHGYLALRLFFRSPLIHFASHALPESAVEWIGTKSSDSSRKRNPRLPEGKGEAHLERLRKTFRGFAEKKFREGFDAIVLGHCHDLDGADFTHGARMGRYQNVGFPRVHHTYLEFSEEGGLVRKPLRRFDH